MQTRISQLYLLVRTMAQCYVCNSIYALHHESVHHMIKSFFDIESWSKGMCALRATQDICMTSNNYVA